MSRGIATFLSVILHPIFVLPLLLVFTYMTCSHLFVFKEEQGLGLFTIYSVVTCLILPLVAIMMMRGLGMITSWQIEDRQERIGPLIVTGLFYIWLFYNYYQNSDIPNPVKVVTLGAAIGLFIAFFMNNFSKLSIHGVGVGGLIVGMIIVSIKWSYSYMLIGQDIQVHNLLIIAAFMLLGGAVLTSRLVLEAHTLQQLYHGVLVGVLSQVIALNILA